MRVLFLAMDGREEGTSGRWVVFIYSHAKKKARDKTPRFKHTHAFSPGKQTQMDRLIGLACGVRELMAPALHSQSGGTFDAPVSGELHLMVGNGHSFWNTKEVEVRILAFADPDSPEAVPWDAATRHATPEAWGLMTNAVSPPGLRPPSSDTPLLHVPRGTAAQVVARVEAGQRVTWNLRASEGEARMAAAFRADRGALERALLRAVEVPAAAAPARQPRHHEENEEELRRLRARLAEAERRAADLQRTVLERDTTHEATRSEHEQALRAARAEIDRRSQCALRSEHARARLRERLREAEAPKQKRGAVRAASVPSAAPAKKATAPRATRSLGCCR